LRDCATYAVAGPGYQRGIALGIERVVEYRHFALNDSGRRHTATFVRCWRECSRRSSVGFTLHMSDQAGNHQMRIQIQQLDSAVMSADIK
jgi:hypothetical protein